LHDSLPADVESLEQLCLSNPWDKDLVAQYFRAYEEWATIDLATAQNETHRLIYLKLKWIHDINNYEYPNEIGNIYLRRSKHKLSFMCLAESLRLNPDQFETYQTACRLFETSLRRPRIELRPNACKVSVIMATCGRRESMKESIQSLLDQTLHDFELVVINDGGDDRASRIVDSFHSRRIRYYRLPENRGQAFALNEGILHATGEYIAYLDDDDVFYPDHLEILTDLLDKRPHQAVAYSNAWWCFGTPEGPKFCEQYRNLLEYRPNKFDKAALFRRNYITPVNVVHRRSCFTEAGLFNEDLIPQNDWDLWMRLALKYGFCQVNRITGEYRCHPDNLTNRALLEHAFVARLLVSHYQFGRGKVGLTKSYLCQGDRGKAERMCAETVDEYQNTSRTPAFTKELFQIRNSVGNLMCLDQLTRDYFWLESRDCLKVLLGQRRYLGFLLVADLFFLKLLQVITRRSIDWAKTHIPFSFRTKR
jgi:glycosyltransferase involved in cell wall biosynthesis